MAPPIAEPFLYHWYAGELPPLTGVAVNVVLWLLHKLLPALEVMLIAGVTLPLTVTPIAFEVTVGVDGQLALEVSLTVMLAVPVSVVLEYVDAVAPEIAVVPLYH